MAFLFERAPGIDKEVADFSATVTEVGGQEPQTVIRSNQAWNIEVSWEEQGAALIPGNWVVDAYVESIGPGDEVRVGGATSAFAAGAHTVNIAVAPGNPPVVVGQETTPFKLVITLTANNGAGGQYSMAGFQEGPILQFFNPV